jgi:hypothetical protein
VSPLPPGPTGEMLPKSANMKTTKAAMTTHSTQLRYLRLSRKAFSMMSSLF